MTPRLWLLFFGDTPRRAWWANFLRPGYRHIAAMSWYAAEERWIYFDPAYCGTVIRIITAEQAPAVFDQLLAQSVVVLRVAARHDRGQAPPVPWCVGQIKALIGIRSWACTPYGLYRDLLARGAEVAHVPCVVAPWEPRATSQA